MLAGFRRSTSFRAKATNKLPPPPPSHFQHFPAPPELVAAVCHVRSTSLPSQSHPALTHVDVAVRTLHAWHAAATPTTASPTWLAAGLVKLDLLHSALDGLLQTQNTHEALRRRRGSPWAEGLLDGFLQLADAYGRFREALVQLSQLQAEAQLAARRGDGTTASASTTTAKTAKKVGKEITRLAAALREAAANGKSQQGTATPPSTPGPGGVGEAELARALSEAKGAMGSASAVVFLGLVSMSTSCLSAGNSSWTELRRRWSTPSKRKDDEDSDRKDPVENLMVLEKCILDLEKGSDRVFRRLLNTRVSLLNILTP